MFCGAYGWGNIFLHISRRLFESCSQIREDQQGWLCSSAMHVTDVSALGLLSPNGPFLSQNTVAKSRAPALWWKSAFKVRSWDTLAWTRCMGSLSHTRMLTLNLQGIMASAPQNCLSCWAGRFLPDVFSCFKLSGGVSPSLYTAVTSSLSSWRYFKIGWVSACEIVWAVHFHGTEEWLTVRVLKIVCFAWRAFCTGT